VAISSREPALVRRFRRSKKKEWEGITRPVNGIACESAFKFDPSASTSILLKSNRDRGVSGKSIGFES